MTEPMANVGSEQEMSELPENKESEAKVEDGNLQTSFEENHADKQISQLPVEADLTGNFEFVEASAEQNLFERSDKADDMPSERQMDGTPLEKETDDTLLEKQTDDQVTMPITGNSESVDAAAEHNLAEKSDKDADMPLKKQTDGTPLEKGTDDIPLEKQTDDRVTVPVTVPLTGNSESVDTSAEHNLAEKSDKAGDTSLEKQTDGTPLEKETNDTPLDKQTDDQVTVPVTGNSKSVEASADHNLAEKSDKDDDAPLEKQTNGTTLENQVDEHVTVPMIQMEPGSDQRGASDVKTAEVNEAVATPLENKTGSAATDTEGSHPEDNHSKTPLKEEKTGGEHSTPMEGSNQSYTFEPYLDGDDSGSEEEQAAFMKELENFYRERNMDFKQPKFYGEPLNCLKLWRAVTRLGGYEQAKLTI